MIARTGDRASWCAYVQVNRRSDGFVPMISRFAVAVALAAVSPPAMARDVFTTWTESATRDAYNGALGLRWSSILGNWQGPAIGSVVVADLDRVQKVRFQVKGRDIMLVRSGGANTLFNSREAVDPATRPVLIVNGVTRCGATRDTSLNVSTYLPLGSQPTLATAGPILIAFDQCAVAPGDKLMLELTTTAIQYGTQTLTAYAPWPHPVRPASPVAADGTAADIVMKISGASWKARAAEGWLGDRNQVAPDGTLRAFVPTGGDTASTIFYAIPAAVRTKRMFLRYTMTVAADWWTDTGGKWPGLANTGTADRRATRAGWGGRLANGTNWSARLERQVHGADPYAAGWINVRPYVYRVNRESVNGDSAPSTGVFAKNVPVTIDEMVQLNSIAPDGTPVTDGITAVWVNGRCVSVMTGIIWRTTANADTLPSEIWLDTYEGGTGIKAPHPMGVTYGALTLSTKLLPY